MFRFMILFTLLLVGHTAWASKDPVDVVVNAFCGDIELVYPRPDACYACTQKLANMVYMLYRKQEWMALGGGAGASTSNSLPTSVNPISSGRLLLKRPSSQKLEEDEIKRNSIDALHGLTLG